VPACNVGLVLGVCGVLASAHLSVAQCPDGTPPPCRTTQPPGSGIAVLLFVARDTADTYLAEGLSEDVGTLLGGVPGVEVKPSSLVRRVQRASAGQLGRMAQALSVRYLVDGSLRRVATHVRLAVQVIDARRRMSVSLGRLYDCAPESLPDLPDRIARDVSTHLGGRPTAARPRATTRSGPAYEHFLRGNFFLAERTRAGLNRAYAEYLEAERLDARYVAAMARAAYTLALGYNFFLEIHDIPVDSLVVRGLRLANRAVQLDSTSSDAWMARGYLLFFAEPRSLRGSPEAFEHAIALDPRNAEAHHQYAGTLWALGDDAGARRAVERALELEPARPISLSDLAFYTPREPARALALADSAIALNPGLVMAYQERALQHVLMRHPAEALADAQTAWRLDPSDMSAAILASALALHGDTAEARAMAMRVRAQAAMGWSSVWGAMAMLALGDTAAALDRLDHLPPAIRIARTWATLQRPEFDALRQSPRFQRLLAELRPPGARGP
jgi:TolB-like protein/Tfp pilus assembly protein PilF